LILRVLIIFFSGISCTWRHCMSFSCLLHLLKCM